MSPTTASDRQRPWPRSVSKIRRRTEETAGDYCQVADRVLDILGQIEQAAGDDPELVRKLSIIAQRDVALIRATLADIRGWMMDAARGREEEEEPLEESEGASRERPPRGKPRNH